jgi:hypothetical protein
LFEFVELPIGTFKEMIRGFSRAAFRDTETCRNVNLDFPPVFREDEFAKHFTLDLGNSGFCFWQIDAVQYDYEFVAAPASN